MPTSRRQRFSLKKFWHEHSLSVVAISILALWFGLYCISDPKTHWGAFFGNAIADWSGTVVIVLATKFFIERGSKESKQPKDNRTGFAKFLTEHSLTIFLVATGLMWTALFMRSQTDSKWGQVAGNIVSEWVQTFGIIYLTKGLVERGSAESK